MVDEDEIKNVALQKVDNPHVKDLVNLSFSLKKASMRLARAGFVSGGCYAACAGLLEAGDHTLGFLCFTGCTIFTGATFVIGIDSIAQYTEFRKFWQNYSIPVKDFILSFFH